MFIKPDLAKNSPKFTTKRGCSPWLFGVIDHNAASYCRLRTHGSIGATRIEVLAPYGTGVARFDGCNPALSEKLCIHLPPKEVVLH